MSAANREANTTLSERGDSPRIAVDGATGYLGNHVVQALRDQGLPVRCLVHSGAKQQDVEFLRRTGAEVRQVSLMECSDELIDALSGCDVAIHLIGSIAPRKGESLQQLHSNQTENLVSAARQSGVRRLIHVTALGTRPDAISEYHRTKFLAEQHVTASSIPYIVLRPSLIIGRQVGNRDSKLVARYLELIRTRPRVPVIGGGKNRIQPIFVGDLAKAIVRCATTAEYDNRVYELGGNEVLQMAEFVERLIRLQNFEKKIAAIPPALANLMAVCCESFQSVPLVSRDQVKLSSQDNVCSDNALEKVFGVPATTIDEALRTYKSQTEQIEVSQTR